MQKESPPGEVEPKPAATRTPREKWLLVLRWTGLTLLTLLMVGALTVVLVVDHYERELPSVAELKKGYDPPQVTRVLARDGSLLASLFVERRTVIPFSEIPEHVKLCFLAAEDAGFYEHRGLNYLGMLRAMVVNLRAGQTRQGASTITQQVIKNVVLDADRTYERKIKETILARRLEQSLTKDEIFGLYLNHIYLGHGRYGLEEAARYYFGKKARDLGLEEGATLAGLVAAPERYSPRRDETKSRIRRHFVLDQMLAKGFVTRDVWQVARDATVPLAPATDADSELAPEVVMEVEKLLATLAGARAKRGGYVVTTSIDPVLQAAARKAVREGLDAYAKRQKLEPPYSLETRRLWGKPATAQVKPQRVAVGRVVALDDKAGSIEVDVGFARCRVLLRMEGRFDPKRQPPSELTKRNALLRVAFDGEPGADPTVPRSCRLALGPEAALVAIDVRTREVRALIGGYEGLAGGLDRALHAKRQPGSAFKPFLYAYALSSRRFTPGSVLTLPFRPPPDAGVPEGGFPPTRGLSVRTALSKSDNDAAVRLLEEVGAPNVVTFAHALGIESELGATPSLALGAYEVTPLELVNAIGTFASGGELEPPKLILKVVGPGGVELSLPAVPPRRRVISAEEAYLITSLMKGVVENGTGQRAKVLGRPLAGKTGTTNQAKDAWFVGYSTEIVAGTWVGYDEPLGLGWGESGAVTALPIWVSFMKAAHTGRPSTDFPRPSGIVTATIDPASGLLAYSGQTDSVEEEFLDGTVPSAAASPDAGVEDAGAPPSDAAVEETVATENDAQPEVPAPPVDAGTGAPPPPF
jgi:penicillin-binding protein 1A